MEKTIKQHRADRYWAERVRQTGYETMENSPPPKTWSARMPAYCHTELCLDMELRVHPADQERRDEGG